MENTEFVIFGLLLAVAGLVLLAGWLKVPYPVMLVVGGLGLGFVPGVPEVELAPELVLLAFLPPLLYSAVEDDGSEEQEEVRARLETAEAAIARIDELSDEDWVHDDTAERMRGLYDYRRRRFAARTEGPDGDGVKLEARSATYQRLRGELLSAERGALVALRGQGHISDEVMRRVERDLDLEESRLEGPSRESSTVSVARPHAKMIEDARAVLQREPGS